MGFSSPAPTTGTSLATVVTATNNTATVLPTDRFAVTKVAGTTEKATAIQIVTAGSGSIGIQIMLPGAY